MENSFKKYFIIIITILVLILVLFIPLIIILDKKTSKHSSSNEDIESDDVIIEPKNKTLREIKIIRLPFKTIYKEGEIFDKTGMIVYAYYDNDYNGEYIDNYIIMNNTALSIYDTTILVYYEKCSDKVDIKIVNDDGLEIYPNPSKTKYTVEPIEGITRFEIEDSDISNWAVSIDETRDKIIKRDDASRGSFLSGMDMDLPIEGELKFYLDLQYNAKIAMSVSYSQRENHKQMDIDLTSIYLFFVDDKQILIDEYPFVNPRDDITKWQFYDHEPVYHKNLVQNPISCLFLLRHVNLASIFDNNVYCAKSATLPPKLRYTSANDEYKLWNNYDRADNRTPLPKVWDLHDVVNYGYLSFLVP